ncbi:MAG: LLM class flavin-dependent oxidoreductase [Nitrososphaerales archaeon]
MTKEEVGIALRSTVFPPGSILRLAPLLDSAFSSVWFPSVGPRFDSLEMCALALGATSRLRAGTGVIRPGELDLAQLAGRADTLGEGSRGRLVLGLGTGGSRGRVAVVDLVDQARRLRAASPPEALPVPIYFAALGPRMVRASFESADGVLLNFCSPGYASAVIAGSGRRVRDGFRVACYLKLFFAQDDGEARRMLVDEFVHYDSLPQYHEMFHAMGLSQTISTLRVRRQIAPDEIAGSISEVSMANPTRDQTLELLMRFREAGVDSPVVYPYVAGADDWKVSVVERLRSWLT